MLSELELGTAKLKSKRKTKKGSCKNIFLQEPNFFPLPFLLSIAKVEPRPSVRPEVWRDVHVHASLSAFSQLFSFSLSSFYLTCGMQLLSFMSVRRLDWLVGVFRWMAPIQSDQGWHFHFQSPRCPVGSRMRKEKEKVFRHRLSPPLKNSRSIRGKGRSVGLQMIQKSFPDTGNASYRDLRHGRCTVVAGFNGTKLMFVKPGYSLNPKFLWSKKIFEVKNRFLKPGWFVKTEFVKSGEHCTGKCTVKTTKSLMVSL